MSMPVAGGYTEIKFANFEALRGTGSLVGAAYMLLLSMADKETGIVGESKRITRKMLSELIGSGENEDRVTDGELRVALKELERRKLVERIVRPDRLCFRMLDV
ncbi:hypothetical protein ACUHMQ_13360 [Chitinimonas sp. PSY-7]|uniref:hypothetical protein n=1 Tax=Chitinimonas sp. PSY-7 TaxID=3459088 RepID=UPI004040057A